MADVTNIALYAVSTEDVQLNTFIEALVSVIQELQLRIDDLEDKIDVLEEQ